METFIESFLNKVDLNYKNNGLYFLYYEKNFKEDKEIKASVEKFSNILKWKFKINEILDNLINENFLHYLFNEKEDSKNENETVEYNFKDEPNPVIFVIDINNLIKIINVTFKDNHGNEVEIITNYYTKMKRLLHNYLNELELDNLQQIYEREDKEYFEFEYQGKTIYFNNEKNVGEYFKVKLEKGKNNIIIFVNDLKNLINVKYITFKDNHGDKVKIISNKQNTIGMHGYRGLIGKYFEVVEHEELLYPKYYNIWPRELEIQFIYNQKYIKYDDNTTIDKYLKDDNNPIIQVNDYEDILISSPIIKYDIEFTIEFNKYIRIKSFIFSKTGKIISNYLNYIDHPELINNRTLIKFLYNGHQIDETISARKCFKDDSNPKIFVLYGNNLLNYNLNNKLDTNINVIFKSTTGYTKNIVASSGTTIDNILKKYLWSEDLEEYNKNGIIFTYNIQKMKFGDQTPIEQVFRSNPNPRILVNYIK